MVRADGRSILLVAQLSPPSTLVAARRAGGMTKYLARLGYSVTVLTSIASGRGSIEGADSVIRAADLLASPLNWRRKHFEALTGGSGVYSPPSRLQSLVVPDLAVVGWTPAALVRAIRLPLRQFDCVVTSGPPQSTHLIGLELKRRGVCWIAELRDGWTFDPPRIPWPTRLQDRLDVALERAVLRRADALVGVTKPIADDLRARFSVDTALVTNGFDPEETAAGVGLGLLDDQRHSLVYTGRLAAAGRSIEPLLAALRGLKQSEPRVLEELEVVFAGPLTGDEQLLLRAPDLNGAVRMLGPLDRPSVHWLQRSADSLLVVAQGDSARSVATGKLFEYLGARRPILVLGEGTEAARIVTDTGAGFVASATDAVAIGEALRRLVKAPPAPPSQEAVDDYAYPRPAEQMAKVIELACQSVGARP